MAGITIGGGNSLALWPLTMTAGAAPVIGKKGAVATPATARADALLVIDASTNAKGGIGGTSIAFEANGNIKITATVTLNTAEKDEFFEDWVGRGVITAESTSKSVTYDFEDATQASAVASADVKTVAFMHYGPIDPDGKREVILGSGTVSKSGSENWKSGGVVEITIEITGVAVTGTGPLSFAIALFDTTRVTAPAAAQTVEVGRVFRTKRLTKAA